MVLLTVDTIVFFTLCPISPQPRILIPFLSSCLWWGRTLHSSGATLALYFPPAVYNESKHNGLVFNLWLQIGCHYLENKRSHYLHSSLQPQSYTLFSYKIKVGRGLKRYTQDKSKREHTLLQAYRPSYREGYVSG